MLRLAIVGLTVGLADSLNPSTVGPAVYLATVEKGARRVLQFTLSVFGVNVVVGLFLVLGPGRLLFGLIPHPQQTARVVASTVTAPAKIALIGVYNLAFVALLLAIAGVLVIAGDAADPWLKKAGDWLQRRWPVVLATVLLLVGSILTVLGGTGLVKA